MRILVEEYGANMLRRNGAGSTLYNAASTQAVRDYLQNVVVICIAFEIVDQDHEERVLVARLDHLRR